MKWIANTSIFRRLLIASVIVAIIPGVVIALLGSLYIQELNAHSQAVQTSTDAVKVATTQLANLQHMNADLIALQAERFVAADVNSTNDVRINQLEQSLNNEISVLQINVDQTMTRYQRNYQIATASSMVGIRDQLASTRALSNIATDQQRTVTRVVQQEWHVYIQAQSQELQALKSNQPSTQTYQLLLSANNTYAPLERDWSHIVALAETVSDSVALVDTTQRTPLIASTIFAVLGIVLVVVMIGYFVNQTIARPLYRLARLTRRIRKGDTSARASIAGNDEIYLVASSMNSMLDNIVQLIQQDQAQRDILQAQIKHLMGEVMGIGEGNLQVRAHMMPGTLGMLAEFFNYMIEALSNLVVRVKTASHEVEASTTVTFNVLAQLMKASDLQLQEIAETTVEVERMVSSSQQVADRTNMLYTVAHEAQSTIQNGRQSVQQAVESMQRIHENVQETATKVQKLEEHSNDINEIITVISDIAMQMNHLAHDAAVQAVIVGQQGKGFGAVAIDIQRQAEHTTSQVSSIVHIVQGMREDTRSASLSVQSTERESLQGTKLAQEAGRALEAIFAAVEDQAQEMDNINHVAKQQLHSFSAIVNTIYLISSSTRQISTSTRNAAHNLEYLARQVVELRNSVEAFKLGQTQYSLSSTSHSMSSQRQSQPLRFKRFRTTTPLPNASSGVRSTDQKAMEPFKTS